MAIQTKQAAPSSKPIEDVRALIAKKAYELYEQSGRVPGRDFQNWLEAERWVKAQQGSRR